MNKPNASQKLVSVLIPCYNHGVYIEETIKSIINQTHKNYEIIIVDAGSDDLSTKQILSRLNSPVIKVIAVDHQIFPSEARNIAFEASKGDFILTLDADDLIHETFMAKTLKGMDFNESVGAVSSKVMYFGYEDGFLDYNGGGLEDVLESMGSHLCALIRRCAWISTGGFDEQMNGGYEDWEFWIRMAKKSWSIKIIPEILFFYRQKDVSRVTDVFKNHNFLRDEIRKKHDDLYKHPFNYIKLMPGSNFS